MKNHNLTKQRGRFLRCLLIVATISLLSLTSNRSFAQFPPCDTCRADIPPTSVAWTSHVITVPLQLCPPPASPCTVQICFCTRETSPGNDDYTVSSVSVDTTDPCASCNPSDAKLIHSAFKRLLDSNDMGFPCPHCPSTDRVWQEIQGQCWSVTIWHGIKTWRPCAGDAFCNTQWQICCNPTTGVRTKTLIRTVNTGTCTGGSNCKTITCPSN